MGLFRGGSQQTRGRDVQVEAREAATETTAPPGHPVPQPELAENAANEKSRWRSSKQTEPTANSKEQALKRRTSRLSLFNMFNKNKPTEMEVKQEKLRTPLEDDEEAIEETVAMNTEPGSRMGSIGVIAADTTSSSLGDKSAPALKHRTSKGALRTRASFKEISLKKPSIWDPPPLFQAYPQAVKHAVLSSLDMPVEDILRLHNEKLDMRRPSADASNEMKESKEKKLKRVAPADVMSSCGWVEKIYVLVTSGYFLQYSGGGTHDRLPEKVMPLTRASAAFASDAIPGKHFVLQVSQLSDEDGIVDLDTSKSKFKKFGLRGDWRRSASSFLLVLGSPKEMSDWLVAVRKEIEALGGKEYRPDELRKHPMLEPSEQLQRVPSHRYLVKKNPFNQQEIPQEPLPSLSARDDAVNENTPQDTKAPAFSALKRQSMATQDSTDSRNVSDTTASIDQVHLDRLRESPRQSFASTGGKTTSTSRDSSPDRSPGNRKTRSNSNCTDDGVWGLLTYPGMALMSLEESPHATVPGRESLQVTPVPPSRTNSNGTSSPPATNFSVPTFSKRYSTAGSPAPGARKRSLSTHACPESPEPSAADTGNTHAQKRKTTSGDLQSRPKSSNGSRRSSSPQASSHWPAPSAPPKPSPSPHPPSSDGERSFSRRFSSLEYARGVSPVHARHSPSPHPPPTSALPPIPQGADALRRGSLIPPPTGPLPPLPSTASSSWTSLPPPTTPLPPIPRERPSSSHSSSEKRRLSQERKLRRPASMQVRSKASITPEPMPTPTALKTAFNAGPHTPPLSTHPSSSSMPSPPKPTRQPPPPPSAASPQTLARKSMPHLSSESPPAHEPRDNVMSRISIVSPIASPQSESAPHPFIPPIRVSERQSRGSFDGPWSLDYTPPKRTFMDLSV